MRHAGAGGGAAVEPAPHRAGEAGVVHRPVPAGAVRSRQASWPCSASSQRVRAGPRSMVRRSARGHLVGEVVGAQPAGHVGDVDRASRRGRARSQRATTESGPSYRRRASSAEAWSSLGRLRRCRATRRSVPSVARTGRSRARRWSGRCQRAHGTSRGGRRCGWWSGRRPAGARARGRRRSAGRAPRRRRAAGRRGRTRRRRSGGWTRPRRPASGRAASRRGRRGGRGARRCRRGCRRTAGTGTSGPLCTTGSSQSAGCAQAGTRRAGLGAREAVGEDLVADLVGHPVRQPVLGADPEVAGVGDVAVVDARWR